MVDPYNVTIFNRTHEELEEFILFCICAAGHKATSSAAGLDRFLHKYCPMLTGYMNAGPFAQVRTLSEHKLVQEVLKASGIGCHERKSHTFLSLASSGINLKACTIQDLEAFKGIGEKTSRFFILHTRPDQRHACLDTHVRKWLQHLGYPNVPDKPPKGRRYIELENIFLSIADFYGKKPADLDLEVWTAYTNKKIDTLDYRKV